jgi:hypothetical protein
MPPGRLRFEPLDPRSFRLGEGPFRARGVAYVGVLEYVDTKLAGGRAGLAPRLGAFAPYFDQLFVATGDYDLSPLVRLFVVLAGLARRDPVAFVEERSRRSGPRMTQGLWKPVLKTSSPEAMAERLPFAFNRYFGPTHARGVDVGPGRFVCEISGVPAPMNGVHVASTMGFVASSLEVAGASDARVDFTGPASDGELAGVPTERWRFVATWR